MSCLIRRQTHGIRAWIAARGTVSLVTVSPATSSVSILLAVGFVALSIPIAPSFSFAIFGASTFPAIT
ncbi:hypothetical protein NL676_024386, partial [Syzygium grande]